MTDSGLSREREKICVYGIGQQYVDYQRLATGTKNRFCGWFPTRALSVADFGGFPTRLKGLSKERTEIPQTGKW